MGSPRSRFIIIMVSITLFVGVFTSIFGRSVVLKSKTVEQPCSWAADKRTRYSLFRGEVKAYYNAPVEYNGPMIDLYCGPVSVTYKLYLL